MTKKMKHGLVLVLLLTGAAMLASSTGAPASRQPRVEPSQADPYEGTTVLTEAFVVEVDLSALYAMDVSPLGETSHSVSVEQLLSCLEDRDKANVLLGVKAAGSHNSRGGTQAKETKTTYLPRTRVTNTPQGPLERTDYSPYEHGQTLSVQPAIRTNSTIALSYRFDYSGAKTGQQNAKAPRDTVSWAWEGTASLRPGRPAIVGAVQDESNVVFLVLTAHILD